MNLSTFDLGLSVISLIKQGRAQAVYGQPRQARNSFTAAIKDCEVGLNLPNLDSADKEWFETKIRLCRAEIARLQEA